ncbi:hypothetical protein Vadar_004158 [Vaccinium darrowii]|uniref:Uncharacterized protein n=1 Tax=Vaccinium darrowii TaxID=229202 RepID=A0ACB7XXD6_9ERIC|nr:hypothetical protein Vadar_004158 [Vaccinium darrowii]
MQETLCIASHISGFMYEDNCIYRLDTIGIHMFNREDDGDDGGNGLYEVINRGMHGQSPREIDVGCSIVEDENYFFDLLMLQAPLGLNQFNLDFEMMELEEEEIVTLDCCIPLPYYDPLMWIISFFLTRDSTPEYFTIKLNHGGNLVKEDVVEYCIDGTVNYFDYCNNDRISRTELQAMCKEVGYVEELSLYYKVCDSDGKWAFKNIQTDGDVTNMVQYLRYFTFVDLATHIPSTNEPPIASEPPTTNEPPPTSGQNPPPTTRRRRQLNNDSNSESDSDCEVFINSDYDLSEDDDALSNANVDTEIEWIGVGQKRVTRSDIPRDFLSETDSEEGDSSDGFMSCDSGSDEDKEDKPKFRKCRPIVGKVQPIIEDDMVFKNRAQCVEAIRQHAILNEKAITFEKNDTDRVRAHYAAPCPWKILAKSITKEDRITLQVKTSNLNHKHCGWVWTNKLLNSSWLARTYFKEFNIKPSWPVTEIVEQVMRDFNVKISIAMTYNARKKAIKKMEGSYVEQYGKLWDYCGEMYLINDLQIPNESTFTIISDKQKGLINAIMNLLPCVEHRHCVRHLHNNMKKVGHTRQAIKERLWSLARATYMGRFKSIMEESRKRMAQHSSGLLSMKPTTGIPCAHALAFFKESRKKVEGIVHHYYQKQTYVNAYKYVMYPMNGMDMWEKTDKPPIQPPHCTRKSRRPKKCRKREVDEPPPVEDGTKKMKRHLKKLSCRRFGGKGHNVRTCPSGLEAPRSKEKQCNEVITQPTFSQPSQPTPIVTRAPKAPARRGGATKGDATPRGGAP